MNLFYRHFGLFNVNKNFIHQLLHSKPDKLSTFSMKPYEEDKLIINYKWIEPLFIRKKFIKNEFFDANILFYKKYNKVAIFSNNIGKAKSKLEVTLNDELTEISLLDNWKKSISKNNWFAELISLRSNEINEELDEHKAYSVKELKEMDLLSTYFQQPDKMIYSLTFMINNHKEKKMYFTLYINEDYIYVPDTATDEEIVLFIDNLFKQYKL